MEQSVPHDDSAPAGVKSWQLWFSLATSTISWIVHLMVVYSLTSLSCEWGWFPFEVGELAGLQVIQLFVTLIATAITLFAGFLAYRNHRRIAANEVINADRHHFMAYLGIALSTFYTALIVISLIPILSLSPCAI